MRRALFAVVLVLALPAGAAACPRTSLGDVEDEVMCPVCKTPLAVAEEAPQAERERAFIQRLISQCRSKDEVKRALVAQYGERVLALPGDEGGTDLSDVLAYLIPALAVLVATAGIGLAATRWRKRPRTTHHQLPTTDSEAVAKDMERYEL